MAISFVIPRAQIADGNGSPYAGAKLYFYDPGTTTERNVYQDADLTSLHMQPVLADSAGRFPTIFLSTGSYKARAETSAGVLIFEEDDLDPGVATGPGALPVASGGTGGTNAAAARSNLGAASASDLSTLQASFMTFEAKVSPSYVGGTRLGDLAGQDTVDVSLLDDTDFGHVIRQYFTAEITGASSHSSNIPEDNTIPQSGEGAELWSQTVTPKSATSKIVVRVSAVVAAATVGAEIAFALFDGGTDAIRVAPQSPFSSTFAVTAFTFVIPAWGVTPKTLSIRYGANTGNTYLNSDSAGFTYGGLITSTIECLEIQGGPF